MKLLIREIAELKHFIGSTAGSSYEDYAYYLRSATEEHLIAQVGRSFYDELVKLYEGKANDEAVYHAQAVIAFFGARKAIPALAVMVNSKGITRKEGTAEKSAYQYQVRDLENSYQRSGYESMEKLLDYLEAHKEEKKYRKFHASAYASYDDDLFVPNTAACQQIIDIHGQRQIFVQLLPHLREAQQRLSRELGDTFYEELFRQWKKKEFARHYEALIPFLRKSIANLAYAEYMSSRMTQFSSEGFRDPVGRATDDIKAVAAAADNRVGALIDFYRSNGEAYLTDLHRILREHPKRYPLYEAAADQVLSHEADDKAFFMM